MRFYLCVVSLLGTLAAWNCSCTAAEPIDIRTLIDTLRSVGPKGEGHRDAMAAWRALANTEVDQLTDVLAGMDGAGPLAMNWMRAAVETIVQRQLDRGEDLPVRELEQFLAETNHAPRARRLAYELIVRSDASSEERLIGGLLHDPSMELRRDAVANVLDRARSLIEKGQQSEAVAASRNAFSAARDEDQIKAAAEQLRDLGQEVYLAAHFGFILRWKLIGPFDNTKEVGFDAVYPPEQEINLNAIYEGKVGKVEWFAHTTTDEYGIVDLNQVFGRPKSADGSSYLDSPETLREHKGVIAYAFAELLTEKPADVDVRLGSINGTKVWLNGELIAANHVYHAAMAVDQYVGKGRLKRGRNSILVKIGQNEQSESWAQRWEFQLRVCDQYGTAVLSTDRIGHRVVQPVTREE